MSMRNKRYSIYFLFLLLFVGCQDRTIAPLLEKAEVLMNGCPDSSQMLLESVEKPEELSAKEYATWCLLVTQARDKNYVEHTSDSVIDIAVRYFAKRNDFHRKAQAYYCKGRVLSDLNIPEEALKAYLKAKEFVKETDDYNLQARICNHLGTLYRENLDKSKSLQNYKEAYFAYQACQDTAGLVNALRNIGDSMLTLEYTDSAFFYLNQALKLANQGKVEKQKLYVLSSLADLYEEQGNYRQALLLNKEVLACSKSEIFLASRYYTIGGLYEKLHQLDSALWYTEKVLASDDLFIRCSANRLLYKIYNAQQKHDQALIYNEQYLLLRDSIEYVYNPQQLAKIETLYNKERLEHYHSQQLQVMKIRNYGWAIYGLIVIVIALFIYAILHKRLIRQQQRTRTVSRELKKLRTQFLDNEEEILRKSQKLESVQQKLKTVEERSVQLESDYNLKIVGLEKQNQQLRDEYQDELKQVRKEKELLHDEKERLFQEKNELIEKNKVLLDLQQQQIEALNKSKQQLIQLDLLQAEAERFNKEKTQFTLEMEQMRLEKEKSIQEERELLMSYQQRCQRYESWQEAFISQNTCLRKVKNLVGSDPWTEEEWEYFIEQFDKVFPEFIERLSLLATLNKREIRVCCLVRLGVKTAKIACLLGLGTDMTTKIKADIRKRCFPMDSKLNLDRILKNWY